MKDNQITVKEFDQEMYLRNSYSRCCYGYKKIKITFIESEYQAEFLTARDTPHHATLAGWVEL